MIDVVIVRACTRAGRGGSPTAIAFEAQPNSAGLDDAARLALARRVPASHTAFVHLPATPGPAPIDVRFFTAAGELTSCGHGTMAVIAALMQAGIVEPGTIQLTIGPRRRPMKVTGRVVDNEAEVSAGHGRIATRPLPAGPPLDILAALGLVGGSRPAAPEWPAVIASPGAPRLLLRAPDQPTLDSIRPDHAALAAACRRHDLVGCFVHTTEEHIPRHHTGAARMFAPAIGVDEDIANANSTAGLAATLAHTARGPIRLVLEQGDHLGAPSTVTAHATSAHVVTAGRAALAPRIVHGGTHDD